MATDALVVLNQLNEAAYLAGLFDVQVSNGAWKQIDINGTTVSTTYFHVLNPIPAPIGAYASGALNTYNLLAGNKTDNKQLFNTGVAMTALQETITRFYNSNPVPYANYRQLGDVGIGGMDIAMTIVLSGTMYQTAYYNLIKVLFDNSGNYATLGTLTHPFYNDIQNVLPVQCNVRYISGTLNFIMLDLLFLTEDINHLTKSNYKLDIQQEIGAWFIGIEDGLLGIGGAIAALQSLLSNFKGGLGL